MSMDAAKHNVRFAWKPGSKCLFFNMFVGYWKVVTVTRQTGEYNQNLEVSWQDGDKFLKSRVKRYDRILLQPHPYHVEAVMMYGIDALNKISEFGNDIGNQDRSNTF